jgi:threonine/homoserine/homoserine lactone efflux protein
MASSAADQWRGLADLLLAYLLVLATPGPNMLLVGAAAALRGAAGALPLCLGVSLGAGALNAALLLLVAAAPDGGTPGLDGAAGRLLGAALLLWVAVSVARRPPIEARRLGRGGRAAGFAAGFCTAATNPVSAAFFAAQFLGPLGTGAGEGSAAVLAPLAVAAVVLVFMLGVAALLARPACRRAALEWQQPVRLAAAVALAFLALSSAATALL